MTVFPKTVEEAVAATGEYRAGATELHERRAQRLADGPLVDLRDTRGLAGISWDAGKASIGATTPVATIANDAALAARYPGLSAAAAALATPQIRAVATLGGNLAQRSRCWYFRSPEAHCLKKGGDRCDARSGDHLVHACFDLGPCIAVHPSTLAMAALAYDAQVELAMVGGSKERRSTAAVLGDGSDPGREHAIPDGALITSVALGAPWPRERAAYFRTISRAQSEWPLVEAIARLVVADDDTITHAAVAIGGVAPVPLRRPQVERALVGQRITPQTLRGAAELARDGAAASPMTAYKVPLVAATVLEVLERATHATPTEAAP